MDYKNLGEEDLELIAEGKTKKIFSIKNGSKKPGGDVLVRSKDRITAGNNQKSDVLEGKSAISNETTARIFEFLKEYGGISTHFISRYDSTSFVAKKCSMIPIEWVTRRLATGSFLKRNPGVPEGYTFAPPKLEIFFKDDDNNDPQWSLEQLEAARLQCGKQLVKPRHVDLMSRVTVAIFEILERAWARCDVTLVDMKIEFGFVDGEDDVIVLADVIDSDSWRIWPMGDKRLMKDKQVYRDLKEVTPADLAKVKLNFEWIVDELPKFLVPARPGRVVIVMGSKSDSKHCGLIQRTLADICVQVETRVVSAHKATEATLSLLQAYESDAVPTVLVAVAGRSNGLGPVLAGNTSLPVVNCPPLEGPWATSDVWSSLRLPSGLGCTTALGTDGAAIAAASILALHDHLVWVKLRGRRLSNWTALWNADGEMSSACENASGGNK